MKLADLKSLFGQKNKFNLEEEIKTLLLNWRHDHDYYNGMLEKIADELNNLTAIAMPDPTQEQWETYCGLMGAWEFFCQMRRTGIEVLGINIARLHYDHGIGLDQLHQGMNNVFDGMGIPAEYWKGEQFEPHALVAQMVQFEGEQRHIATFIDDKTYEEAARAVGEVMGEGGITKAQAIHTVSVIRRCYESHEQAKALMVKQQEALQVLKAMIEQQASGATIH
ncbi:hypothetical protein [Escherichia coli]|uniref:hypothetical protein n=1 Tax=Escherichia coli TaxID=562 RepID=UPI00200D69E3|nr:hypothetical protein [Escherichia coli]